MIIILVSLTNRHIVSGHVKQPKDSHYTQLGVICEKLNRLIREYCL